MNVLSLFNGMSTGHTALDNVGIKVDKYYSSEIKPAAIKLTQHHYPDTIQLGDVTKWEEWDIDWKSIDMVLSGSPCQDLSIAGKRKGLSGERSGLFLVFVDILNYIKEMVKTQRPTDKSEWLEELSALEERLIEKRNRAEEG